MHQDKLPKNKVVHALEHPNTDEKQVYTHIDTLEFINLPTILMIYKI
jgi:hypothetical protein